MKSKEIRSKDLNETVIAAENFIAGLKYMSHSNKAVIVGLSGDLGSGKTTFAKALGAALGIEEQIQSPTFIIQKIYVTKDSRFKKLYHLDLYRIDDPTELRMLRMEEIFNDPANLVLIEWPEKASENEASFSVLPDDMIKITFEFIDETTRKISYSI